MSSTQAAHPMRVAATTIRVLARRAGMVFTE
jgi:hypothetical protein